MNYSSYKIFLNDTLELARTMVIKIDWLGLAMERKLFDFGLPPVEDRRQWRYYMHLAGMYHHLDEPMKIISLDTSEEIDFTIENLKRHKKTKSVYLYNRTYTDVLKEKYPEQTNLVRGIMHPISMDVSINAPDGTVLWFDGGRVERQEHNLIQEIEKGVRAILYRFSMDSLFESDDLYVTDLLCKIFSFLPSKILLVRRKYARTEQAHTFHIMAFLASNQRLDSFVPYLTLKQILFLYKNLLYIERNTGKQKVFDMLVQNLLTVRNLPLYEYSLRQRDMDVLGDSFTPTPVVVKDQLNLKTGINSRDLEQLEVTDLVYKEMSLARDNSLVFEESVKEAEMLTEYSSISNIPTKVLEVSAVDPDDISPIKLSDTVLNEWLYMSSTGQYQNRLEIVNPLNGDLIKLTPGEMFLLFFYSHAAGFHDIHLEEIPVFIAKDVMVKKWISAEEYLAVVEHDHFGGWDDEVDFFVDTHMEIYNQLTTSEEFIDTCNEIAARRRVRHQYIYNTPRHTDQVGRKAMYNLNYRDYLCDLRDEHTRDYEDFFIFVAIDRENMSAEGWRDLAMQALDLATNFASDSKVSLKDIQRAMVKLFTQLSSYSIQFIEEIIGGERLIAAPILAIPGETGEFGTSHAATVGYESTVKASTIRSKDLSDVRLPLAKVTNCVERVDRSVDADMWVSAEAKDGGTSYADVNFSRATVSNFRIRSLG